jgi:hypothetical protein
MSPSTALIAVLCCAVPSALFAGLWMMLCASNGEALQQSAVGLAIICITFLVAYRAFESCAIRIDDEGIQQIKLVSGARFFAKQKLLWSDVLEVAVQNHVFRLTGRTFDVAVQLMVFSNQGRVVNFVNSRLPEKFGRIKQGGKCVFDKEGK